jgi:hypothetical protein
MIRKDARKDTNLDSDDSRTKRRSYHEEIDQERYKEGDGTLDARVDDGLAHLPWLGCVHTSTQNKSRVQVDVVWHDDGAHHSNSLQERLVGDARNNGALDNSHLADATSNVHVSKRPDLRLSGSIIPMIQTMIAMSEPKKASSLRRP